MDITPLVEWMEIDSTTGREERFLRRMEVEFEERGMRVVRQRVERERWNIHAVPGAGEAEFLLSTHVDTVPPFFGPTVDDGVVRGRGACDTKGGLFSMLCAWDALPRPLRNRVGFLLVVGEEVDHIGAIVASQNTYRGLRATLLCEPTQNRLATGQKGILKATLSASGVAGHSAFPESGSSAVHALVAGANRLLEHRWPADPTLGPTTVNVGTFAGGVAANVIADRAEAEVLFRATGPVDALYDEARRVAGADVDWAVDARNEPTKLLAWPSEATTVVPFNTDAPYLQELAPVVLVGPGDIRDAHSPRERISVSEMAEGAALYQRLLAGLDSGALAIPR